MVSYDNPGSGEPRTHTVPSRVAARKVALWYGVMGALWILGTDWVLHLSVEDSEWIQRLERVKGWFFILVTALLLWWVLDRYFREIRQSSQALRESEERWQFAIQGSGVGVWDWHVDSGKVFFSASWKTLIGVSQDELGDDFGTWKSIVHPEDLPLALAALQDHLEGNTPAFSSDHRLRCKDGSFKWVRTRGKVVRRDSHGRPSRVIGTHTDLTEDDREESVMQARLRLLEYSFSHSLDELLVKTLDEAEALTGSCVGFYHFLEADQQTLSLQAWSTNTTTEMCRAEGKGRHYDVDEAGVWVDCIYQRKPIIHNDYASLPNRKGLPPGHAPVTRELVVPVYRGESIVAILGVGNKSHDYNEDDIRMVTRLADLAWDIAERKRAEVQLNESRERYRLLVETAAEGIWAIDRNHYTTFVNPAMAEMLGTSPEALLGGEISDWFFPEDFNRLLETMDRQAVQDVLELRLQRGIDSIVWVQVSVQPILDGAGNSVGYFAMLTDITSRKQAETQLRQWADAFQNCAHGIGIGIPGSNRILAANPALALMVGRPVEELQDASVMSLYAPEDHGFIGRALAEADRTGQVRYETRMVRKDGTAFPVQMDTVSVRDDSGKPLYRVTTAQDISERRRAQEALQQRLELQDQIARIAATVPGMIYSFRLRPDGTSAMPFVTPMIEALFGLRPEVVVDDFSPAFERVHPEDVARLQASITESARTLSAWRDTFRVLHPKLGEIWLEGHSLPRREPNGDTLWHGFVQDITERKRAEKALVADAVRRRILVEQSRDGIVVLDDSGGVYEANERYAEMLGYTPEEVRKLHVWDWESQYSRDQVKEMIRLVDAEGDHFETIHRRKDGSVFDVEISTNGAIIEGRKLIFCVCRDISNRKRAEAALRERNDQFRLFIEHSPAAIAMLDKDMRYLFASRRWLVDYRLPEQNVVGRSHYEVFPEIPERWKEIHRRCLAGAVERCSADPFPRADGSLDWVRWEIRPWFTVQSEVGGLIIMSEVITDRMKTELALQQSEEEFRAMFEVASIGMAQADPWTGKFSRVNPKMCEITGYSSAELLQKRIADLTHPDDQEANKSLFEKVLRGEIPSYHLEKRYLRKNDSVAWVSVNMTLLKDESGQPIRTLATIEDINERKRAEDALRESEERFRSTLDDMLEGCQLIGFDWRYRYLNAAAARQGRTSVESLLGRTMMECYPGIESTEMFSALSKCMSDRIPQEIENEFHFRDGSRGWFQLSVQPTTEGIFVLSVDISDRKRLEADLRQAQKLEGIGQLAGGIAHDFNNILAAVMMNLDLLQMNSDLDDETRNALFDIKNESNRAAALTRQLLMFSRRSVLDMKALDVNETVANLLKMLRRLIGEHIDLRFDGKTALPLVEADAGMVEQILMNLVVNARDAMPRGGRVTITTDVQERATAAESPTNRTTSRFVSVAVSDSGIGMDEETIKRIFEPFFTTKEVGKGTGLGLATVHGIVGQHGGRVEVESQVGVGSTFRVLFPALERVDREAEKKEGLAQARRGNESILFVEDDATLRRLVVRSLGRLGYKVFEAGNGREALSLWETHGQEIDLVLTDMVMPEGMTGLELIDQLQKSKPGLAVIIASGYSTEMVQAGIPDREGIVYLPKPFQTAVLANAVRGALDLKKRPA